MKLNYVNMKFQVQVYVIPCMDPCTKLCELEVSIITCILAKKNIYTLTNDFG